MRRRDDAAFYAFPSYLHLTASIRDDHEVRGFLNNCTNSWSREDDLAFLITPQHFAEALVHGTVAGMESPTVRSGISVLRYLEGFSEILDRVKHDEALAYSFLRQARWSRHIPVVINRLELWADRMAEWDPFGENSWEKFQARLWTLQGYVREFHGWSLVGQKVVTPQSIESLLQEGRTGAAIRLARDEALHRRSRIGTARTEEYAATAAAETVEACEKLAEIGGLDAAAVILAPIISKLAGSLRGRAQAILAQVRNRSSVDQPATQLYMEHVPVPAHSKPATMEMKKTSGGHEAV